MSVVPGAPFNVESTAPPSLLSGWISAVRRRLQRLHCRLQLETAASVSALYSSSDPFSVQTAVSPELEAMIVSAFCDDLYDGRLHCATIREQSGEAAAIVFWRDVEEREISKWIRPGCQQLIIDKAAAARRQRAEAAGQEDASAAELLHSDGQLLHPASSADDGLSTALAAYSAVSSRALPLTSHHWVKVELVVVRPSARQHHLGTLLLCSTLLLSAQHFLPLPSHALLHLAGGQGNAAAASLYRRMGFVPIDSSWVTEPNREAWVMLDVRRSIATMDWDRVLGDDWRQQLDDGEGGRETDTGGGRRLPALPSAAASLRTNLYTA
jgi:GNAT superfamily N-acetyltransferase